MKDRKLSCLTELFLGVFGVYMGVFAEHFWEAGGITVCNNNRPSPGASRGFTSCQRHEIIYKVR